MPMMNLNTGLPSVFWRATYEETCYVAQRNTWLFQKITLIQRLVH